ncbi:hypothetical protein AJ87_05830 [Rhizobium yanglingense]|nr:hypothetical protein AJ87_05830 [Rhizobium yanglingense]
MAQIETEDYRDRPVVVYDAHFHPDTGALLQVEPVARGYLDVIEHIQDDERGYYLRPAAKAGSWTIRGRTAENAQLPTSNGAILVTVFLSMQRQQAVSMSTGAAQPARL